MVKKTIVTMLMLMGIFSSMSSVCADSKYTDVKSPSWYSSAVSYVVDQGYMVGVTKDRFDPMSNVTRAQIVQILYAMEGKPVTAAKTGFSDVPKGRWYSDAVNWAASKDVVSGYLDGTFQPDQPITREQMTAILFKYSDIKGYKTEVDNRNAVKKYSDSAQISNYAKTSMEWAVQNSIISGTEKGIEPKNHANRAQVAVILNAFDQNVAGKSQKEGQDRNGGDSDSDENNSETPSKQESSDESWETPIAADNSSDPVPIPDSSNSGSDYSPEFTWETPIA